MKQTYLNMYRRLSNFQLAFFAGQGKGYLSKGTTLSIKQDDRIVKAIDYNSLSISVDRIMKLYDKKTWKELYAIETGLIDKSEYLKAYFVRLLSQKCAVKYYERGKIITNKALLIWSLFFEGKEELAEKIIDDELHCFYLKLTKSKLYVLRDIISGTIRKNYLQGKLSLYNLGVCDRDVTIVGPLSVPTENPLENLNPSEIFVQINYFAKNDKNVPDISFYNGETLKAIDNGERLVPKLSGYVFHRFSYEFQNRLRREGKAKLIYNCDYLFGLGQPNMLPNILFQLIAIRPNTIKVNGFNLYMSKLVYNNSYLNYSEKERDITALKDSFSRHNIISQYLFIDTLYKNNLILVDKILGEILDNGIEYYLTNLEDLIRKNSNSIDDYEVKSNN